MKKKIFMGVVLLFMLFFATNPVLADQIHACDDIMPNAIIDPKIPDTVSLIIKIIRVAAPVLLVIFGSIDLLKGVMAGKEDEIKKGQQTFIKRLIAAALVFFVFVVVQFVVSLVASEDRTNILNCADCFINGGKENCKTS